MEDQKPKKEIQSLTFEKIGDLASLPIAPNVKKAPVTMSKQILFLTDKKEIIAGFILRYNQEYHNGVEVVEKGTVIMIDYDGSRITDSVIGYLPISQLKSKVE